MHVRRFSGAAYWSRLAIAQSDNHLHGFIIFVQTLSTAVANTTSKHVYETCIRLAVCVATSIYAPLNLLPHRSVSGA